MKTVNFRSGYEIKGIYITPQNKIIGIPMFVISGQEIREFPKCVELWQKNGDGKMHLKRRWRKTSIAYIEYSDTPNTWVEPRSLQRS